MVNYHCIAVGCNNDSRKSNKLTKYPNMVDENGNIVRFFVLPSASKQPRFRRRWIEALRREILHPNRSEFCHAVCSRHFTDGEPTDAIHTVYFKNFLSCVNSTKHRFMHAL